MASELLDMLKRMSEVDEKQNYQGVFILRKSDVLSTLQVTHGVDDKGVWESLEALNGEPRKVVRRDNSVISIFPARELVTIRQSESNQPLPLHRRLPENIDQLEQFYTVSRLADDRIANHNAIVVDLVPTDSFRYGYRYWLDKNTGMLLRCDLIADDEAIVEQMMFTSLDYLTETPRQKLDLQKFEAFKQQIIVDNANADTATSENFGWVISQLPKGFMLMRSNMRYSRPLTLSDVAINKDNNKENVIQAKIVSVNSAGESTLGNLAPTIQSVKVKPDLLHLVYSDGLASVSVFIKKSIEAEIHYEGASSMGSINAFGNFVDDYFVTVVGVVPVNTVQAMAQSAAKTLAELSN